MCATCGCDGQSGDGGAVGAQGAQGAHGAQGEGHTHGHGHHGHGHNHAHAHDHVHAHHHVHAHDHAPDHAHDHAPDHADNHARDHRPQRSPAFVDLETRVLARNDQRAARNRAWLAGREILALNLVSSPGAGKTTLLVRTIRELAGPALCVIEGDQETTRDAERIRGTGAAAVQVNTGTGCHLDADMVARGLQSLAPPVGAIVMIENVGNLVCPALFDLGEHAKVVVLSVAEGDDKPLKYPHMFRAAALVVIHKIDLLPHVDFDVSAAIERARQVNPRIEVLQVSARTGEGMADWYAWILRQHARSRQAALV